MEEINQEELNYLSLIQNIMDNGEERPDRTGVGVKSIFGTQLRFSLQNDTLPLLTTKKVFFKAIVEELLFFIRGETDTKKLEEKGVNIWRGNTSREFLDGRGLTHLKEGDMGKGYGYQWRKFGGHEGWYTLRDIPDPGIDQLQLVIDSIKNDPFSRRHIITAWNPQQLNQMVLPPCHYTIQFYVSKNKELSCQFTCRSTDAFLGLPYNIASYALFTHIMATATKLTPKEIIFNGGDVHLYLNHIDAAKEQMKKIPYSFPQIKIKKIINNIKNMETLVLDDFQLVGYQSHPSIKAEMAI